MDNIHYSNDISKSEKNFITSLLEHSRSFQCTCEEFKRHPMWYVGLENNRYDISCFHCSTHIYTTIRERGNG